MSPKVKMNLSERISSSITKNNELAKHVVAYYTFMAERGNADAQYALGLMLQKGEGIAEDFHKSMYWIEKAAAQGHPEAIELYRENMEPDTDARYDAYV